MTKNYLIYPCKVMRITQSYTGTTSHLPHTTGRPKDYPVDEGCSDTGRDWCYCPCDEMIIKRIYGVGTKGTNTLWLESTKKVVFADGTKDFFTMLITHPDDDDLKKLKPGQKFKRKEKICREGTDGATAYHFHISGGKGKFNGNGWVPNTAGKYVLTTTNGQFKPEKLFFIDTDFTKVVNDKGLDFKPLPKYTVGTYEVSSKTLIVRNQPSKLAEKKTSLKKGDKVEINKIDGDFGRYKAFHWINLNYCKQIKD